MYSKLYELRYVICQYVTRVFQNKTNIRNILYIEEHVRKTMKTDKLISISFRSRSSAKYITHTNGRNGKFITSHSIILILWITNHRLILRNCICTYKRSLATLLIVYIFVKKHKSSWTVANKPLKVKICKYYMDQPQTRLLYFNTKT